MVEIGFDHVGQQNRGLTSSLGRQYGPTRWIGHGALKEWQRHELNQPELSANRLGRTAKTGEPDVRRAS
jgi:hypothetical protein